MEMRIVSNMKWSEMVGTARNSLSYFSQLIWDGILTGKNLLPYRDQILSCKSPVLGSENK